MGKLTAEEPNNSGSGSAGRGDSRNSELFSSISSQDDRASLPNASGVLRPLAGGSRMSLNVCAVLRELFSQKKQRLGREEQSDATVSQYKRKNWLGRVDCSISLLAGAIGLGNMTHFPYLAHKHGAGTFLFPFILVEALVGVPIFYLEACLGQVTGKGSAMCWDMVPLFKGLGVSMALTSALCSVYYSVLCIYPFFYFGSSFIFPLPWAHCHNPWNTADCIFGMSCKGDQEVKMANGSCYSSVSWEELGVWNATAMRVATNHTYRFSSYEYWIENIEGKGGVGPFQPKLVGCLFIIWTLVFLALAKDVLHLGKIMIFNMLIMYMVLIVLVINGALLTEGGEGVKYFLTPKWSNWFKAEVWLDASGECFFGAILGTGVISTITSYSRYSDGNTLRMSMGVVITDALTSVVVGFVFFARMGYLAHELGLPIQEIAHYKGSKLAYVVYPESILRHKIGPFLSIVFFLAVCGVGMTSLIAFAMVVPTALLDQFPRLVKRRYLMLLGYCLICFLLSLPFTLKGGNLWVNLLSSNVGPFCLLLNGLIEVLVVAWGYGVPNLYDDLVIMIGKRPSLYFKFCWKYIIPLYLSALVLWTLASKASKASTVKESVARAAGFTPVLCVLICMAYLVWKCPQPTYLQRVKFLLEPDPLWTRNPLKLLQMQSSRRGSMQADVIWKIVSSRDSPNSASPMPSEPSLEHTSSPNTRRHSVPCETTHAYIKRNDLGEARGETAVSVGCSSQQQGIFRTPQSSRKSLNGKNRSLIGSATSRGSRASRSYSSGQCEELAATLAPGGLEPSRRRSSEQPTDVQREFGGQGKE